MNEKTSSKIPGSIPSLGKLKKVLWVAQIQQKILAEQSDKLVSFDVRKNFQVYLSAVQLSLSHYNTPHYDRSLDFFVPRKKSF